MYSPENYLTIEECIKLGEKNGSCFFSFKLIDNSGNLLSIDTLTSKLNKLKFFISGKVIKLRPFLAFDDPFRSHPTTTIFCEDISLESNPRSELIYTENFKQKNFQPDIVEKYKNNLSLQDNDNHKDLLEGIISELSFLLEKNKDNHLPSKFEDNGANKELFEDYFLSSQPEDKLSDLRAEILKIVDQILPYESYHYHGKNFGESIIGIYVKNMLELADVITVIVYIFRNVSSSYGFNVNLRSSIKVFNNSYSKTEDSYLSKVIPNKNLELDISLKNGFNPYIEFLKYF